MARPVQNDVERLFKNPLIYDAAFSFFVNKFFLFSFALFFVAPFFLEASSSECVNI